MRDALEHLPQVYSCNLPPFRCFIVVNAALPIHSAHMGINLYGIRPTAQLMKFEYAGNPTGESGDGGNMCLLSTPTTSSRIVRISFPSSIFDNTCAVWPPSPRKPLPPSRRTPARPRTMPALFLQPLPPPYTRPTHRRHKQQLGMINSKPLHIQQATVDDLPPLTQQLLCHKVYIIEHTGIVAVCPFSNSVGRLKGTASALCLHPCSSTT